MRQSLLSWTHYLVLLQVFDSEARDWYEKEALKGSWSVRTLQRNVYSDYYHRMLLSQKKELVKEEMLKITAPLQEKKLEFVKNPMILEFLGIPENNSYTETKLEKAIIDHLQNFLIELGNLYLLLDSQFEYNTYIRDFFNDNKNLKLEDAIKCWNYKKKNKGSHKYEKDDLKVLK